MQWRKWRKIASLWRFELDAKRGPLETGDFGEIGEIGGFGENRQRAGDNGDRRPDPLETGDFGENRQRVGNIQNVANIQIGCHLKLAPSNKTTKEAPIAVRQHLSNTTESNISQNGFI